MSESEIWQIIQTGNEISVMRIQVFITITVGVLVISSLRAVSLNRPMLAVLLVIYVVFGYVNFYMTIAEMRILESGIELLRSMQASPQGISPMGQALVRFAGKPSAGLLLPVLQASYWTVTVATVTYSLWRCLRREGGPGTGPPVPRPVSTEP